ncbi:MAG: UDP-N-acetylmuramoyl-L-alanyl-D-glutamate--2,6-diaminopimelate ligase, partial [Anaerotruncus sp.]|nr:UDP-N-acetylmuramoyl-L-alanyl-D-glutamate--2,6-diaminopimelate ligase [Anaerotruncus sp.]
MIDYAHNAMSLESLLTTIRKYNPKKIYCLFGCGGNRAKARRYEMGEVSSKLADLTVVTSDNPRSENPAAIINDILEGMKGVSTPYKVVENRKEAIKWAMENAKKDDIILLAGKGHETYQILPTGTIHFDEREVVADILKNSDK